MVDKHFKYRGQRMSLAKQLHIIGDTAFRHPWRVIAVWLSILAILGIGALQFYKAPSSNISIPGTQAQQTIDRVEELFPDSGGASGRIVFHVPSGTIQDKKDVIEGLVADLNGVEGVSQAVSPFIDSSFISDDKTIAYSQLLLDGKIGSFDDSSGYSINKIVAQCRSDDLQF